MRVKVLTGIEMHDGARTLTTSTQGRRFDLKLDGQNHTITFREAD